MDTAIDALEFVVSKEPAYKDSLMYLGRAYYRKAVSRTRTEFCSGHSL